MFCAHCGNQMADDAKFCPKCGQVNSREQRAPAPPNVTPVAASVPPPPTPMTTMAPVQPRAAYAAYSPVTWKIPCIIHDVSCPVYTSMDPLVPPTWQLSLGDVIDLGKVVTQQGHKRVEATLADGQRVYLDAEVRVYRLRLVKINQKSALVYADSASDAPVSQLPRNVMVVLCSEPEGTGKKRIRICDADGRRGYIDGDTKVLAVDTLSKVNAGKDILVGALWCVGGIVATAISYGMASNAESSGGHTYFVFWGAVIFGGYQFLRGLFNAISSGDSGTRLLGFCANVLAQEKAMQVQQSASPVMSPG